MQKIVILGGGFAGAYCAQALERTPSGREADILLVDRHNYFVFYPLLVEAGTGSLEPRHAVVSIRSFQRRGRFLMGEVVALDTDRRTLTIETPHGEAAKTVAYDQLVIALGSVTRLPPVPGLAEHGYQLKGLTDAVALRDRAIQLLEEADATDDPERRRALLHFLVVGSNFTGIEVAGELFVFLRDAARHYRRVERAHCRVTIVELADRVLTALDPELSRYAHDDLTRRGIDIRLGTTVNRLDSTSATLSTGETLDTHTVIWTAGIAAPPILTDFGLPLDERGYLRCDRDLRVEGHPNVWGIGDAAVNRDADGNPYPATAQHAVQAGRHAARNVDRVLRGMQPEPFDYSSKGALAALGCRTGVARVGPFKLRGFAAWFLWRTVYLMKMPGWSRRLRVALDWTADLVFRRDFVELGVHRVSRTNAGHVDR